MKIYFFNTRQMKLGAFIKSQSLFFFFLVFSMFGYAQAPTIMLLSPDSTYKDRDGLIQMSAEAMLGSNVLDNLFIKKSLLGGHLENSHLNSLNGNLHQQNRAGFIGSGGLQFLNFRDTLFNHPHWGLRVDVNTNYHASANFSRDLFTTVYRGNASFRNDTAVIAPIDYQYQSWQKFGLGIFNKHNLSSITLSLVEGQSFQSLQVSEASLYTSQLGDSIIVNYRGDYVRSDSSKFGWANGSGLGAALDLDYNLPLADNLGFISVSLHDIGFVVWNKMSQKFSFDSLSTWTGVQVSDVFQLTTDTLDLPNLRDSLHFTSSKKSFVSPLPASIHLRYCRYFTSRDFYEAGLSMWPGKAALPLVYAGLSHFVGKHFVFSERISFGGYGRFGVGVEMQWMPCSAWIIRGGTRNIGGFTMGSSHGIDGYLSIAKTF
jgi:hypothetical protein